MRTSNLRCQYPYYQHTLHVQTAPVLVPTFEPYPLAQDLQESLEARTAAFCEEQEATSEINSAIYYRLISRPTRLSFVLADIRDRLTVRQHLVVGGLTFFRVDEAELKVDRALLLFE